MGEIHEEHGETERQFKEEAETENADPKEKPDNPDESDSPEADALDPEGDDDPDDEEFSDEEYEHALKQSEKEDGLDDSDRLDHLSEEENDAEAKQDWDNDNGLVHDVHKQYDKMIADYEEKDKNGELDEAGQKKLADMKETVESYNETGVEMGPQYPEKSGFYGEVKPHMLGEDEIVSRFDDIGRNYDKDGRGSFVSPKETDYDGRSLAHDKSKKEEHFYRVEPGEKIEVQAGEVRDFEEDKGTGSTQYHFEKDIKDYIEDGKMYECDAEGNRLNPKKNSEDK